MAKIGCIYKRGNIYWIKYYRSGKPYYESTRSKKEADAKRLLKKREGEISGGKLPGVYFDKVTFDELAEAFLSDYRDNEQVPDYLKDFCTFGYKLGWRISEIAGLNWGRIDLNQGIVRLEPGETKNDEGRTIYLDQELKEMFDRRWKQRKNAKAIMPYVFQDRTGTDKIKRFDKAFKKACKDAGIGVRLFHDFRRTAVRNMVRSGIPERVAMMISGHKTRSVFDRYDIGNYADLKLAAQSLETYLNSQTVTKTVTIHDFEPKREVVTNA